LEDEDVDVGFAAEVAPRGGAEKTRRVQAGAKAFARSFVSM
jgi:hypothetical protein